MAAKTWVAINILLLFSSIKFQWTAGVPDDALPPQLTCYFCHDPTECSNALNTMEKLQGIMENSACVTYFDLTADGGPILDGLAKEHSEIVDKVDRCVCEDKGCEREVCRCYGKSFCNGKIPDCSIRVNPAIVPGCKPPYH